MAETLTYDGTEADAPELTPEEQDSLAVGEKMMADQEELLAGKYRSAQDLEKAYLELQKKLGEGEADTAEAESEEPSSITEIEITPAVELIQEASAIFAEKGALTDEVIGKFSEMNSADLVKAYADIQAKAAQVTPQAEAAEISDSDVDSIKNMVGGDAEYDTLMNWVADALPESQAETFNNLVETGNVDAIRLAVQGLKAQYDNVNGYEGRMLQGKAPQSSNDVFRSQAELVRAMSDPRYDSDPAYRADVIEKLERSDVNF